MHGVDSRPVDGRGRGGAGGGEPTDDLGRRLRRPVGAAGVDAFGRHRKVEVLAGGETADLFEDRLHDLAGRARVGRRFEHDDLARLEHRADRACGGLHVGEVGLALLRQRRRERDQDRACALELVVVRRRGNASGRDVLGKRFGRYVLDVAPAGVDPVDELGDHVDDERASARFGEGLGQRQADIAGADDGNVPGPAHGEEAYRAAAIRPLALPSP